MMKKIVIALIIALFGIGVAYLIIGLPSSDFPKDIKRQIDFPLYYPKGNITPLAVDRKTIKLIDDPKQKNQPVISFVLASSDNKVTISEQQTPDLISEQLGLDKLASTMNVYKEAITSIGRIELTRPKELNGSQTAVAVPNFTTLIFARPEHDLDERQWRQIFNSLELVR